MNKDDTLFSMFFTDNLQWRAELVPEDWKILKDCGLDNYVRNLTTNYDKTLVIEALKTYDLIMRACRVRDINLHTVTIKLTVEFKSEP